jgi:hypothetical protein
LSRSGSECNQPSFKGSFPAPTEELMDGPEARAFQTEPLPAVAGYCTVTVKVVCTGGFTEGFPVATTVKV